MYIPTRVGGDAIQVCWNPQRPEEGIRFPGARAVGGCEIPNIDAGKQILTIWKSRERSQLLSSLSVSPPLKTKYS